VEPATKIKKWLIWGQKFKKDVTDNILWSQLFQKAVSNGKLLATARNKSRLR
jgi:hypothetical protein